MRTFVKIAVMKIATMCEATHLAVRAELAHTTLLFYCTQEEYKTINNTGYFAIQCGSPLSAYTYIIR